MTAKTAPGTWMPRFERFSAPKIAVQFLAREPLKKLANQHIMPDYFALYGADISCHTKRQIRLIFRPF